MNTNITLEALKTAILLEIRGKAFYETVASQANNEEVRRIFSIMATEEQLHFDFLSQQYKDYQRNGKMTDIKPESVSGESIVKMVLNREITSKISAAGFEAAAISAAIDMESKAIKVYSERAREAQSEEERKLFEWLAEWEQGHHKILHELNEELKEKIWHDNQFWPF